MRDLRQLMGPYTAKRLQSRKGNKMRDFVRTASLMGVSHLTILRTSDRGTNLQLARVPSGPTVTFRVSAFSLIRDCQTVQKRPVSLNTSDFMVPPLVVLNNFSTGAAGSQPHLKVVMTQLQALFPAIKVNEAAVRDCKRVALFTRDPATGLIELRHYAIRTRRVGSQILRLQKLRAIVSEDVSGYASTDSEGETMDASSVPETILRTVLGSADRSKSSTAKIAVKLYEIGPRVRLEVLKIEEGVCGGPVLYHSTIVKTSQEVAAQEDRIATKKARREEQERRVAAKRAETEAKAAVQKKRREEKEKKRKQQQAGSDEEGKSGDNDDGDDDEDEDEQEAEDDQSEDDNSEDDDGEDEDEDIEMDIESDDEDNDGDESGEDKMADDPIVSQHGGRGRAKGK